MTSKECELQLNQLIIDWDENNAIRLNTIDIEAIKHLLLENQMQQDEIVKLRKIINTYEDPEDLTLMYMWCNEKAKDKIKQLEKCYCNRSDCSGRIKDSRKYDSVVQQLDKYKEVIEEVREYVDNNTEFEHDGDDYGYTEWVNIKPQNIVFINELLQILDKIKE